MTDPRTDPDVIARLERIEGMLKTLTAGSVTSAPKVLSDKELDSEYGNFFIKRDPNSWKGESMIGKRLSDCPAEYLDEVATMYDRFAAKAKSESRVDKNGKPDHWKEENNAARARGWKARVEKSIDDEIGF